jgi:hypothetical protein
LFEAIKAHKEELEEEGCVQAAKKDARAVYTQKLAHWAKEEEQKKRNEEGIFSWEAEVAEWTAERQRAKARKEKLKEWEKDHPKPKKGDFQEKSTPCPKMQKITSSGDKETSSDDSEWEDIDEHEE